LDIENPNFLGREEAIADLNIIAAQGAKVIVIQSAGGILVKSMEEEIEKERSVAPGYKGNDLSKNGGSG
jgi:hypothetical protein